MDTFKQKFADINNYSLYLLVTSAFFFGIIFGPLSYGIKYFIAYLIFYELIVLWVTSDIQPGYRFYVRVLVNLASIIGWLFSRYLFLGKAI